MKPLDNYELWAARLSKENSCEIGFDIEESKGFLKELLEVPINIFPPVLSWYMCSKWIDVFRNIKANGPIEVLELASGESVHIPIALSKYYNNPETKYTTFNLNKKLTENFRAYTKDFHVTIDIIEDAGQNIEDYIGTNKIDAVIFEHAINDIFQGILAERHGIDTINTDWFEILPKMVEIISEEYSKGTFECAVKNEFITLLKSCLNVLKPTGVIAFFHHMYQMDIDCGYNIELYENMINIVRKWIIDEKIGCEVFFDGFDSQWWMFIQK